MDEHPQQKNTAWNCRFEMIKTAPGMKLKFAERVAEEKHRQRQADRRNPDDATLTLIRDAPRPSLAEKINGGRNKRNAEQIGKRKISVGFVVTVGQLQQRIEK